MMKHREKAVGGLPGKILLSCEQKPGRCRNDIGEALPETDRKEEVLLMASEQMEQLKMAMQMMIVATGGMDHRIRKREMMRTKSNDRTNHEGTLTRIYP